MTRYSTIPTHLDLPALESGVLDRWHRDRTFERSVEQRAGAPLYAFDDGPPFATGLPHYGHILTSYIKDVVPRYFTMRGRHVPRRWGWDCHGLPVEYQVEKELGLSGRGDIVAMGLARFTEECRSLVLRYADEWERVDHAARTLGRLHACLQDDGPSVHGVGPLGLPSAARAWACSTKVRRSSPTASGARHRCPTSRRGWTTPIGRRTDLSCIVKFRLADDPDCRRSWHGRRRPGRCRRTSRWR